MIFYYRFIESNNMTINTFYVMYGIQISKIELWNYFYSNDNWSNKKLTDKSEDALYEEMADFVFDVSLLHNVDEVTRHDGESDKMFRRRLNDTEKSIKVFKEKVLSKNPNFDQAFFNANFFCIPITHDIGDDDYLFVGHLLLKLTGGRIRNAKQTESEKTISSKKTSDKFLNHKSDYEKSIQALNGTSLEKLFSETKPILFTLQDDCGCCS